METIKVEEYADLRRAHDDRVARHMAEARSVALHSGVEDLRGRFLGDGAGDNSCARALAI